jgi:O-glycosyl hydrolase
MHAWAVHGYTDGVHTDTGAYSGATPTDKPLWMTETQGTGYGIGLNDWGGAMTLAGNILSYLRNGRITVWTWGSVQTICGSAGCEATAAGDGCLIMNGTPTAKWYAARHFYRFIRPGARQIASTSNDGEVEVVAFRHDANACWTVVLRNRGAGAKTVSVSGADVPSQWTMEVSTASTKRVQSTVGSTGISVPATSVVTLVSGQYAHANPVAVIDRTRVGARGIAAPVPDARHYTVNGRLVDKTHTRLRGVLVCEAGRRVVLTAGAGRDVRAQAER